MDYVNKLRETLLDKGYPKNEVRNIMVLIGAVDYSVKIPDPVIYDTKESYIRFYKYWYNLEQRLAKDFLIYVDYMRPVWGQYKNWEYEI